MLGSSIFKSFARSAASAAGREISRSVFGTAPKRRRRKKTSIWELCYLVETRVPFVGNRRCLA